MPRTVTVADLEDTAEQLVDALAVYDRFVDAWPDELESVRNEVEAFLRDRDEDAVDSRRQLGMALATSVESCYHDAREAEATYVEQARERGRQDWSRIVAETAPVRQAASRVHAAGFERDPGTGGPETGDPGDALPADLCPAHRVSMNAGSTPVTYEHRVAQYRAVADRYDLAPEVLLHPGSGHDVSLSAAFPESRVVYVDVDVPAMTDLERAGYEAVGADATGFEVAGGADVIVFRNAGLLEEAIVEANLRPGGWVLANDHLASASHVARLDSIDLVGVVPDDWTDGSPPVLQVTGDTSTGGVVTGENRRSGRSDVPEQPPDPSDGSTGSVDGLPWTDDDQRDSTGPSEVSTGTGRGRSDPRPSSVQEGSPLDLYVFRSTH